MDRQYHGQLESVKGQDLAAWKGPGQQHMEGSWSATSTPNKSGMKKKTM